MDKLIQIVKGCIKKSRLEQAELYKMFASKMYAVCLRYSANDYDAQDLLQEGFLKIFDSIKSFKWQGSLEGWMKRIFVNLALDKYRNNISYLSIDEPNESNNLEDNEASVLDTISEKEIMETIRQLPDQYRLVFNLYIIEGNSHEEISKKLNIGVSTSRSNLARAKTILKQKINNNANWFEKAILKNG